MCCTSPPCCVGPSAPTVPVESDPPPKVLEKCACRVVFENIEIHDNGETGKAEWDLHLRVNGKMKRWKKGSVRDKTYPLGITFALPDCDTPIRIRGAGWEEDPGGAWACAMPRPVENVR